MNRAVYDDEVGLGRGAGDGAGLDDGAAEPGVFVTSGFDGDADGTPVEVSPGDDGLLAPPLATALA